MANIFETARAEHQYNKFVSGIASLASLVDTLSGPGPFTIFVPSDAAFDLLSSDQQANIIADPEKLARVLKYHIVPGYYTTDDLLDRLFLKTLGWERLRVWSDISMVPLGAVETDIPKDALSYIARNTVNERVSLYTWRFSRSPILKCSEKYCAFFQFFTTKCQSRLLLNHGRPRKTSHYSQPFATDATRRHLWQR